MNTLHSAYSHHGSDIAIIGMVCRLPGANDINSFWQNLRDGVESVSFFTDEELVASGIDTTLLSNPSYVKAGGVIENIEMFDALFFDYSPREAAMTDPQHRLFLECAAIAIERAGYNPEKYDGLIGVYAGVGANTYFLRNLYSNSSLLGSAGGHSMATASDKDFLTTRVSYKLNLKGPSVNVQTACSTSLVTIHLACQALLSGECDMALAGGVSIRVPQKEGYLYQEDMIFSPDGHCRAFDVKAQGTIGGSGVGIVVLKRLEDALADGDCIHAVIKGSAINNDGALKVGYTAPSVNGQAAVIAEAQAIAGADPETITYIETHGTGTALGDPIEIAALTQAFRASTEKKGFCALGSVKTNVGHLDSAAGVTGLIKTVLALKHKMIPPSLHFEEPNPKIDFENSPFYVNSTQSEWKTNGAPRRAGVSSFGIGGTNAHVVLEEAPAIEPSGESRPWQLLVLSAKTSSALDTATVNLVEHLKGRPDINLADVAYTLTVGRRAFSHRRMLVCQSHDDAVDALRCLDPKRVFTVYQDHRERPVLFMFSGQGAQYVNMGLELYRIEPTFREHVNHCSELLKPHLKCDLRDVLYPSQERAEEATQQLNQTAFTQPALFVIEYAMAQLWMAWGVRPQAMIGHSIGEYVAACLAGVFSVDDALSLVAARGRMMQQLPVGAMLAVPLPEKEVLPLLGKHLSLAAVNGPSRCVVSGRTDAVESLQQQLAEQGMDCRRLHTSHAFHSEMMDPILEPFTELAKKVSLKPPSIPYASNVTGTWITAAEATDPHYWAGHLRQTVRFAEGLQELLKDPSHVLLELGPGQTLSTLATRHPQRVAEQVVLPSLRHPHDRQSDGAFVLNTVAKLWLAGVAVDWSGLYAHERRYRLPLPTYPFERQRYWIDPPQQAAAHADAEALPASSLLGKKEDIAEWFYAPLWKRTITIARQASEALVHSCWLVFLDESGLGSQLVKKLKQQGQDVVTVQIGSEFSKLRDRVYQINPQQRSDYDRLLNEGLRALDKNPDMIVHLWSVTSKAHTVSGLERIDQAQSVGFYSLLFLAQALRKVNVTDELQLAIVSNNIQDVTGDDVLFPEKATVLGPCRVIPQEYPNIRCRNIDIVLPKTGVRFKQRLTDQLLRELTTESSDPVVAYRGGYRFVQTFEPVRLDGAVEGTARLRNRGVYLITGGLGGIGLVLAEYLVKTVQAKLILTGRSAFPIREEWDQWLTAHEEQDGISRKIRKVLQLEELGAEVLVVSADVADAERMQAVIVQAEERFGQINGVIHTAGVPGGGIIQTKALETAESILAPKVKGTLVIDALLKDVKLDFFVLCSSLTSVLAGFGQVDYCAANAFLDAFAHDKAADGSTSITCINWEGWQEVGMAVNTAMPLELKESRADSLKKEGISPEEGTIAFTRILGSDLPQVFVSTYDFPRRIEQANDFTLSSSVKFESVRSSDNTKIEKPALLHPRPNLLNPYVAPGNEVEETIAATWRELLGVEQVGIHDNFFELGGDSLLGVQIISRVREAFEVELPLRELFEEPTIVSMSLAITKVEAKQGDSEMVTKMLDELEQLPDDEARRILVSDPTLKEEQRSNNGTSQNK